MPVALNAGVHRRAIIRRRCNARPRPRGSASAIEAHRPLLSFMIRRLLARFLPGLRSSEPHVYTRNQHPVRAEQVSAGARSVTRKLQEAGFKAFVVGGAVRDLMLGIE